MKQQIIVEIEQRMQSSLDNYQLELLNEVLESVLQNIALTKEEEKIENIEIDLVEAFLAAKRVEGCSEKTLRYLNSRSDENPALFVALLSPHSRLKISGVEIRLRELGRRLNMQKVHPHKFRRTLATMAIDKGMPVEQVQQLLGHSKIDTTMQYAMVNQNNVKISHRKYIG